jgi:hypothetical protein
MIRSSAATDPRRGSHAQEVSFRFVSVPVIALALGTVATHVDDGGGQRVDVKAPQAATASVAAIGLSGLDSIDFDARQRSVASAGVTGQPDTPERQMAAMGLAGIESVDFGAMNASL